MMMMELFSGPAVMSLSFQEEGYETQTLDKDPVHNADLVVDLNNWDYASCNLPIDHLHVGFDCTTYTKRASCHRLSIEDSEKYGYDVVCPSPQQHVTQTVFWSTSSFASFHTSSLSTPR